MVGRVGVVRFGLVAGRDVSAPYDLARADRDTCEQKETDRTLGNRRNDPRAPEGSGSLWWSQMVSGPALHDPWLSSPPWPVGPVETLPVSPTRGSEHLNPET